MKKKQSGKKIYSKPEGQWLLYDIPEETRKLAKGYAQERGEKVGVCVGRLLKEAIAYNTAISIQNSSSPKTFEVTMHHSPRRANLNQILSDDEKRMLYKKPKSKSWWKVW